MMKRLKKLMYTWIIVKEWAECGEFDEITKAIVVGNYNYAVVIKILLRRFGIDVCFCTDEDFYNKYRKRKNIKWILANKALVRKKHITSTDVIVIPNI
jgi:hypothetical protein